MSGYQEHCNENRETGGKAARGTNTVTYSVPLSTICVSSEMPSRLMNSWAKVMSREELARSFRASSFMSMLDDWMRSCSCWAIWACYHGHRRGVLVRGWRILMRRSGLSVTQLKEEGETTSLNHCLAESTMIASFNSI